METGQTSYLCLLPMLPRDLSAAAVPREELRYREQPSLAVQNSAFILRFFDPSYEWRMIRWPGESGKKKGKKKEKKKKKRNYCDRVL